MSMASISSSIDVRGWPGAGTTAGDFENVKSGMAIGGLIGYGAGTVGAGLLSFAWTPSMQTQKWMWAGYGLGILASSLVYPLYLVAADDAFEEVGADGQDD